MIPTEQIAFDCRQTGNTALAVFTKYAEPVGAGTELFGTNCARFYGGLISALSGQPCAWSVQFCAEGVIIFLPVIESDVKRALAAILLAFSRFNSEETSWCAQQQPDGTWRFLFPKCGEPCVPPAENPLLPQAWYRVLAELAALRERLEELKSALELGTISQADFDARFAWLEERADAVIENQKESQS